jgi:hypothetical protein
VTRSRSSSAPTFESDVLRPKEERVARAALMREAALKCVVFVGVPKVCLVFHSLANAGRMHGFENYEMCSFLAEKVLCNKSCPCRGRH